MERQIAKYKRYGLEIAIDLIRNCVGHNNKRLLLMYIRAHRAKHRWVMSHEKMLHWVKWG
jgi:hypothetical protein